MVHAVPNHPLEFWSIVGGSGFRSIDILPDNGHPISFGVFQAIPSLAFDGALGLVFAGIPAVEDGFGTALRYLHFRMFHTCI